MYHKSLKDYLNTYYDYVNEDGDKPDYDVIFNQDDIGMTIKEDMIEAYKELLEDHGHDSWGDCVETAIDWSIDNLNSFLNKEGYSDPDILQKNNYLER